MHERRRTGGNGADLGGQQLDLRHALVAELYAVQVYLGAGGECDSATLVSQDQTIRAVKTERTSRLRARAHTNKHTSHTHTHTHTHTPACITACPAEG
jgi:hypothetical protein